MGVCTAGAIGVGCGDSRISGGRSGPVGNSGKRDGSRGAPGLSCFWRSWNPSNPALCDGPPPSHLETSWVPVAVRKWRCDNARIMHLRNLSILNDLKVPSQWWHKAFISLNEDSVERAELQTRTQLVAMSRYMF